MTRLQLILVGALSTFVTILVLVGSDGKSGLSQAAERALLGEPTTTVAAVEAGEVAGTTAASSNAATATTDAGSSDAVETPTFDATAGEDATGETASTDDSETDDADAEDDADADAPAATTPSDAPPATNVKHVFVITLQGRGFDAAFGAGAAAPYLSGELRPKGTLLTQFSSLGNADLADRIAFAGGQPPNPSTKANCPVYKDIPPSAEVAKTGEVTADGCIYPNSVVSLGDQLTSNRLTWQAYSEDHEKGAGGANATCRRPFSGDPDDTQSPRPGDAYAAKNTPFVYFHSLLDLSGCDADVGPLTKLDADLADPKATPNLAYLAPNLCHDGSDTACDGPAGLAGADAFLRTWVPKILDSKAYQEAGLLVITFAGGPAGDDTPSRNGTLLLSRYAEAGATDDTKYDPYGLLRSVEDLLGIKPLAKAKDAPSFAGTVLASAKVLTEGDG